MACGGSRQKEASLSQSAQRSQEKLQELSSYMLASYEATLMHSRFQREDMTDGSQAFRDMMALLKPLCTLDTLEDRVGYPEGRLNMALRQHIAGVRCPVSSFSNLTMVDNGDRVLGERSLMLVPAVGSRGVPYVLSRLNLRAQKVELRQMDDKNMRWRITAEGNMDPVGKDNIWFNYSSTAYGDAGGAPIYEEIRLKVRPLKDPMIDFVCTVKFADSSFECTGNGEVLRLEKMPFLRPVEI